MLSFFLVLALKYISHKLSNLHYAFSLYYYWSIRRLNWSSNLHCAFPCDNPKVCIAYTDYAGNVCILFIAWVILKLRKLLHFRPLTPPQYEQVAINSRVSEHQSHHMASNLIKSSKGLGAKFYDTFCITKCPIIPKLLKRAGHRFQT